MTSLQYKHELCVYGYLRGQSKQLQLQIPDVLMQICLLFYLGVTDEWDPNKSDQSFTIINQDKTLIQAKYASLLSKWKHAFGMIYVAKGQSCLWRLKMNIPQKAISYNFWFGIIEPSQVTSDINGVFCDKHNKGHGLNLFGSYGMFDIITMKLDMICGALSFEKNGILQHWNSQSIDTNKEYCMAFAVSLRTGSFYSGLFGSQEVSEYVSFELLYE